MYGCNTGIGVRDIWLTPHELVNARHAIVMFQCFYLTSLIFVKSSICFALLRIATNKLIRQFLYVIIFLSFCCGFVTMVACLAICVPVSASWTGVGRCAAPVVIKNVGTLYRKRLESGGKMLTSSQLSIPQFHRWLPISRAPFFHSLSSGTSRWRRSSSSLLLPS